MTKAACAMPGHGTALNDCRRVMDALGLRKALKDFRPRIVGTIPLDIHTADSDIDVVCEVRDLDGFASLLHGTYGHREDFTLWRRAADEARDEPEAVIARMETSCYPVEVWGQDRPTVRQTAYRHYVVQRRLLRLGGEPLREAVQALKEGGEKTEPAFCRLLGLSGDPYRALLALEDQPDAELSRMVSLLQAA